AAKTWASNDLPATLWSTFGRSEHIRLPSPAASTIARHVLAGILNSCAERSALMRSRPMLARHTPSKRRQERGSLGQAGGRLAKRSRAGRERGGSWRVRSYVERGCR